MQTKTIKPSNIVNFDNEFEIEQALLEAINDKSELISFEKMYQKTLNHLKNLF